MAKAIQVRVVSDRSYDDEIIDLMVKDSREYAEVTRAVIAAAIVSSTGCNLEDYQEHINNGIYNVRMKEKAYFIIEGVGYDFNVYLTLFEETE